MPLNIKSKKRTNRIIFYLQQYLRSYKGDINVVIINIIEIQGISIAVKKISISWVDISYEKLRSERV